MTKKKKLEAINIAMETGTRKDTEETKYHFISEKCEPKLKTVLMKLIYDDNIGGESNLSYDICYDALNFFCDIEECLIDDMDSRINDYEPSSVYTYTQLQYLNNNNNQEISDLMREYEITTISNACAWWYDNMVHQAISTIISDYINAK